MLNLAPAGLAIVIFLIALALILAVAAILLDLGGRRPGGGE